MSDGKKQPEDNPIPNKQDAKDATDPSLQQQPQGEQSSSPPVRDRLASGAAAATHQLVERTKHLVNDLNLGDQLSVALIFVFTSILLLSPYAIRHMKEAASTRDDEKYDDRWETEDPVDEFAKLARKEWGLVEKDEMEKGGRDGDKNVVEVLLRDVFKSEALQHAAQDFVVEILQSERFKDAISRLVKELWSDLVSDPETVAQVVKLLEIAIQNPDVKLAAQELVLHVFVQEAEVRDALIGMIQQLGEDDLVRQAVVRLLTDSAHTTLNDPDVLDHSMEFATDVVGDDIVQQTAGEALRKSVGHAVRPATTVFLTAAGVGFLIFGVVAVGYSRSSEQEAVLFESAARSLQSNASYGISRIVTWPLRAIQRTIQAFCNLLPAYPSLEQTRDTSLEAFGYIASQVVAMPFAFCKFVATRVADVVLALAQRTRRQLPEIQVHINSTKISEMTVALFAFTWSTAASWSRKIFQTSVGAVNHLASFFQSIGRQSRLDNE